MIVKCAKSLTTLPYLSQDDVYLAKQIITIAVNMANNDSTVIRAIEDIIELVKELVNIYKTTVSRRVVVYSLKKKKKCFFKNVLIFLLKTRS